MSAKSPAAAHPRGPRETVELLLRTTAEGTRDQIADLYAPDVVIEIPFAPNGIAAVTEGRESMRARMNAAAALFEFDAVSDVRLHETADPEVIVAEYRITGRVTDGGQPFSLSYITVTRVRDGLIVSSRDYGNPLEVAALLEASRGRIA
ncbi:nuclear transport factor 2 family protein [Actinocrinis puniceicyclus]|uniref:Nuclear transport factor 2 family protein n=1 Tax=Actinocrinis puniceicyclus TaxID=977794 RepID=A0A8J7WQG9_9ACTN|nr:nuclear transport factor 2 family protein [Actinocrinis puniceicyclus]MBS2964184.1 nuclear transport factor 2 family protein [Actinocrinis puniceicyclus]